MIKKALIELQYLPCLEFFTFIYQLDQLIIECNENFVKQTFRNRTNILNANGETSLTIPVLKSNSKILIRKIEIDNSQNWMKSHWRSIQSSYGKAPYFEYYSEEFRNIFSKKEKYLFDFNWHLLTLCLKNLQINKVIIFTKSYEKAPESSILDIRSIIHPKVEYSTRSYYQPIPYIQLFGNKFVPNLSIIDLLFCEGPNASNIIAQSAVKS